MWAPHGDASQHHDDPGVMHGHLTQPPLTPESDEPEPETTWSILPRIPNSLIAAATSVNHRMGENGKMTRLGSCRTFPNGGTQRRPFQVHLSFSMLAKRPRLPGTNSWGSSCVIKVACYFVGKCYSGKRDFSILSYWSVLAPAKQRCVRTARTWEEQPIHVLCQWPRW